jgi:hypothetical protein
MRCREGESNADALAGARISSPRSPVLRPGEKGGQAPIPQVSADFSGNPARELSDAIDRSGC